MPDVAALATASAVAKVAKWSRDASSLDSSGMLAKDEMDVPNGTDDLCGVAGAGVGVGAASVFVAIVVLTLVFSDDAGAVSAIGTEGVGAVGAGAFDPFFFLLPTPAFDSDGSATDSNELAGIGGEVAAAKPGEEILDDAEGTDGADGTGVFVAATVVTVVDEEEEEEEETFLVDLESLLTSLADSLA